MQTALRAELATAFAAAMFPPTKWLDLLVRVVVETREWDLADTLPPYGYAPPKKERPEDRRRFLAGLSEARKRTLILDLLVSEWQDAHHDGARKALYADALRLAGIDRKAIEKRVRAAQPAPPTAAPAKASTALPKAASRPATPKHRPTRPASR